MVRFENTFFKLDRLWIIFTLIRVDNYKAKFKKRY